MTTSDTMETQDLDKSMIDNRIINNGNIVEEGIKSEFWQEIVGPELHKMITGTGSYQKKDGGWVAGHWAQ